MNVEIEDVRPWHKPRILAHLAPIVQLLHEAAEHGTNEAAAFFDGLTLREAEKRDPYLFAHLVRFHVGQYLSQRGQDAAIDTHWLANSGVAFRFGWIDVRFLKSAYGQLPAPGPSMTKRRFYNQYISSSLWDLNDENVRSVTLVNIVVTWSVDGRGHLTQLVAYCPSEGLNTLDSVHSYWSEPLVHPAEAYEPEPAPPQEPGEDREELDISDKPDEAAARTDDDIGDVEAT